MTRYNSWKRNPFLQKHHSKQNCLSNLMLTLELTWVVESFPKQTSQELATIERCYLALRVLWEFQLINTDNLQKLDAEIAVLIWMQGCCVKQPACSVNPIMKPEVLGIIRCCWQFKSEIQECGVTRLGPHPNHYRRQAQVKDYPYHRSFCFPQLAVVVHINTSYDRTGEQTFHLSSSSCSCRPRDAVLPLYSHHFHL